MPLNAGAEYFIAQEKYLKAKTRTEKIKGLEEMIRTCPKHKSAENMLRELKSKLAKLKSEKQAKISRLITTIPKEGDAQVTIVGMTQVGKSTLLSKLTNAKPRISPYKYTTTKPEIGALNYKGVIIQVVEIPSTFRPIDVNIAQNSDLIIFLYKDKMDLSALELELSKFKLEKPIIKIQRDEDLEKIKEKIWNNLDLIKIYTKEPGKDPEQKALVLKKGSTVKDVAKSVHKDFLKFFKFARVWGKSAKYPGQKVGLEHILKDDDIVEIHAKA
ncbi:MAG: TGS domain-containing protein [Candidatus Aenigmarchaeota archaeon]|nr:TGS domain-containing protein [Candidatus Aenigmarchaeota archaeon]